MNIKIYNVVKVTEMDDIPANCSDCDEWRRGGCSLPQRSVFPEDMKKPYLSKRHKDCPLRLIEL